MSFQPVLERELRVQARWRETYWLRVLAGGAAAVVFGLALLLESELAVGRRGGLGPWLFAMLHTTISIVLALACPLMTADTLARERREGTLGLLLLTPLRPGSIVIGKMTVHLIRAFTMWLSVMPVLTVPFLLGGVGVADIGIALAVELGVVLGGLAAGLLASSFATSWGNAMALAALLALLVGEGLALLSFLGFLPWYLAHEKWVGLGSLLILAAFGPWLFGSGLIGNGFSGILAQSPPWMRAAVLTDLCLVVAGSLVAFCIACWLATVRVRNFRVERVVSPRQESLRSFWLRLRWTPWHRGARRRNLGRNPMLWLYRARPHSRLRRWGWVAIVMLVWCGIFTVGIENGDTEPWIFGLPIALVVALALVAAAGFQREMEEGILEAVLITPLRPSQLLQARIATLWADFLPAMGIATLLAALWITHPRHSNENIWILYLTWSSFVAVPFVGSRFGVRRVKPLLGWLWTVGLAGVLPWLFGVMAALAFEPKGGSSESGFIIRFTVNFVVFQLFESGWCAWATINDLKTRRFQLKPLQSVVDSTFLPQRGIPDG